MPNYTQTSTYNKPVLHYSMADDGYVTVNGAVDDIVIPMILTQYSGIEGTGLINTVTTMPIVRADQGGFAYGGNAISEGAISLPRLTLGGTIDTPFDTAGFNDNNGGDPVFYAPAVNMNWAQNIDYAEFIIACMEGRVSQTYQRFDPTWFRDPFGRQFNNVRIIDFSASYVEGVPGRSSFTATLLVL